MGKGLLLLVLIAVAVAVAMLYRASSQRDLPEDEWFDFEQPST
jgi:hypothetical protein